MKLVGDLTILEVLIKRLQTTFESNQIILATTNLKEDDILIEIAKSQNIGFFRGPEEMYLIELFSLVHNSRIVQILYELQAITL